MFVFFQVSPYASHRKSEYTLHSNNTVISSNIKISQNIKRTITCSCIRNMAPEKYPPNSIKQRSNEIKDFTTERVRGNSARKENHRNTKLVTCSAASGSRKIYAALESSNFI